MKLTDFWPVPIIESILNNPAVYLKEIQQNFRETSGTAVAESTICRYLHKCGFSQQKLAQVAKQRIAELRATFQGEMKGYSPHKLVLLMKPSLTGSVLFESMGMEWKDIACPAIQRLLVRGERYSAISALSATGMIETLITEENIDAELYMEFVETRLLPDVMPFDGRNWTV